MLTCLPSAPKEEQTGSESKTQRLVHNPAYRSNLAPISQHREFPGFALGSCWRIEIRSGLDKIVRLGINSPRSGPELCLDGLGLAERIGRVFVVDVDHALALRNEQHTRFRLKHVVAHSSTVPSFRLAVGRDALWP
jgi:hypothetical protein